MTISELAKKARESYLALAATATETRNNALIAIADALDSRKKEVFEANKLDVEQAEVEKLNAPMLGRLKLGEQKYARMTDGVRALALLPDPLNQVQYAKQIALDMSLYRVSCPIGVVGVIFESRPDALVQISTLCLKSGNAVLLKGGREALRTNEALSRIINETTAQCGLPSDWCALLRTREDVNEMLKQSDSIDLIIPRGSNAFVKYIMQNSDIPVLGHAEGLCHVYVDSPCDIDMAVKLTVDSKTQNLSVCNCAETLLVHRDIAEELLPRVFEALRSKGVQIRGDETSQSIAKCDPASDEDWSTEYLDAILSVRVVDSIDQAIVHINGYGSHHTDSIITADNEHAEQFFRYVDSADVFLNCSTRFSDGFLYGLGAEVGIATGKLHARGPMGLEGLCTYKYRIYGNGQTLEEVNNGMITLRHEDIESRLPK